MYGIEYSALANSILKKEIDQTSPVTPSKVKPNKNASSNSDSIDKNNLLLKLQSLVDCPEYLIPNLNHKPSSSSLFPVQKNSSSSQAKASSQSENSSVIYYTDDFILLSEFSEIEGPKPLLTIPTDGGTGFNKNEYALHLMCVDFHSHLQPQKLSAHNSSRDESDLDESKELNSSSSSNSRNFSKFSLTKDTSIINYLDANATVAACVHHFTLYDLTARGFVRPFCLAYVSYEKNKPIGFFEQIRAKFTEITDLLKKSNFNAFKHELEQRCLDIKFTRDLFAKWCEAPLNSELSNSRQRMAKDYTIDNKTFARLNSSCSNDTNKNLQIHAIDNLLKEMESVLAVVVDELKSKNWLVNTKRKPKSDLLMVNKFEDDDFRQQKCASAVEQSFINENADLKPRSSTYPMNKEELTIKIDDPSKKKANKKPRLDYNYVFRKPKLLKNILIGNLGGSLESQANLLNDLGSQAETIAANLQNLDQVNAFQPKPKLMKRLHQLCLETAKQAINELRLMQRYFSTPYYLLKFKELTSNTQNQSSRKASKSESINRELKSKNCNLFWSITLGNCVIADFSTNIDTFNLNKYALIKKSNIYNKNLKVVSDNTKKITRKPPKYQTAANKKLSIDKNEFIKSIEGVDINSGDSKYCNEKTLTATQNEIKDDYDDRNSNEAKKLCSNESIATQFYSPIPDRNWISGGLTPKNSMTSSFYADAIITNTSDSKIYTIEKVPSLAEDTKLKRIVTNDSSASWNNLERYLDFDQYNDEDEDEFYSDIGNSTKTSDQTEPTEPAEPKLIQQQKSIEDEPTNGKLLYELYEYEEEYNDDGTEVSSAKEENEYDFANSLLTLEYKPYNQYSNNLDLNGLYLTASSLSLTSLSVSLYYSALNRFKYQSTITDKLIQISEFNFEETLRKLLNTYSAFLPHVIYSLLKGRPVICVSRYCKDLAYLSSVVDCLSNLIPNSFYCLNDLITPSSKLLISEQNQPTPPKYTSSPYNTKLAKDGASLPQLRQVYERKPIKLNDLKYCKLFGLNLMISKEGCCSADCASQTGAKTNTQAHFQHQHKHYHVNKSVDEADLLLKYIPITVRNYVSILDLDNSTFYGPKYKGHYLSGCVQKCKHLPQDSICYLFLLTHVAKFYVRVAFLYNYSILFDSVETASLEEASQRQNSNSNPKQSSDCIVNSIAKQDLDSDQFGLYNNNAGNNSTNSNTLKKERILRYFSFNNGSFQSDNGSNSNRSHTSSISSIASAILGESKTQKLMRRHSSQQSLNFDNLQLLRSILANVTSFNYAGQANMSTSINSKLDSSSSSLNVSTLSLNSNSSSSNTTGFLSSGNSFEQADLDIVVYILKSLKIKQVYLYNLAMQKKKLKQLRRMQKDIKLEPNEMMIKKSLSTYQQLSETDNTPSSTLSPRLAENTNIINASSLNDYYNYLNEQKNFVNSQIQNDIQLPLLVEYEEMTLFHSK